MAGGPHADIVPCMVCLDEQQLTRASRVVDGLETDHYCCEHGHSFGLDWPEPAHEPQWPPSPDIVALTKS